MQAARYRLRFITGVALTSRTYGAGTYGDGTYGEQASDALSELLYYLVPWPGGYLPDPAWIYRQGDTLPTFKAVVMSTDGPLELVGVALAYLVLTNTDGGSISDPLMYELTVTPTSGIDWLTRDWHVNDLSVPGTYRAGVVLTFDSGRRLTVPIDDRLHFVINPNTIIPPDPTLPPDARWDDARWDLSRFEEAP